MATSSSAAARPAGSGDRWESWARAAPAPRYQLDPPRVQPNAQLSHRRMGHFLSTGFTLVPAGGTMREQEKKGSPQKVSPCMLEYVVPESSRGGTRTPDPVINSH